MDTNATTAIGPVATLTAVPFSASPSDDRSKQEADRSMFYRLVIEQAPQSGIFIYKTVDRATGEVIRQLPREDVVKLFDQPDYKAGTVTETKA